MKTIFRQFSLHIFLLAGFSISGYAQKLPDVQPKGLLAPAGIKIDGKNNEWNNSFQALNKRTNIFYTVSNDENNLYLVVKSTDIGNNTKILAGGITFSVNPDGKKKEKESITLTYPVVKRGNLRGGGGQGGMRRQMGVTAGAAGGQVSTKQRDSMMAAMQRTQLAQIKEIQISGFKNTTDTLVSIYNEYGIKAFASIDNENNFFYEMAIPLVSLGISKDNATEFVYNIKLNGLQLPGFEGGGGGYGGGRGNGGGGGFGPRGGGSGIDFQSLTSPTDFWGKYTLVKKQ